MMDSGYERRRRKRATGQMFPLALALLLSLLPESQAMDLVATGATWAYLKGRGEASTPDRTAWRQPGFDDTSWPQGTVPFYYGEALTGTALTDMRYNYTCVFLRRAFLVDHPADYTELVLGAISDDGFIGWINGFEVARYNVRSGDIAYDQSSLSALQEPIHLSLSGHGRSLARGGAALYAAVQARPGPTFSAADQANGKRETGDRNSTRDAGPGTRDLRASATAGA